MQVADGAVPYASPPPADPDMQQVLDALAALSGTPPSMPGTKPVILSTKASCGCVFAIVVLS